MVQNQIIRPRNANGTLLYHFLELAMTSATCTMCGIKKPQTAEFFHRATKNPSGFTASCKRCRNKAKRKSRSLNDKPEVLCSSCLTIVETLTPETVFVCAKCQSLTRQTVLGTSFRMIHDPDGMRHLWGMLPAAAVFMSVEDGCFSDGTRFERLVDRRPTGQRFVVRELHLKELSG